MTRKIKSLIESAKRKIRKNKIRPPSDGSMVNVIYRSSSESGNGYHYQVDYICDKRFNKNPYIFACSWKPGEKFGAPSFRGAREYIPKFIKRKK